MQIPSDIPITGYTIQQLIDFEQVRQLLESHQRLSGMAYGLFDTAENCHINVGWQEICMRFHCSNPIAAARCRESRAFIKSSRNSATGEFLEYRCKNGMIVIAMPLIIDGKHLATFFAGQFFYENDLPDKAHFIKQAEELGFDREAYLTLLAQVPVFSHEHIRNNVLFLHAMVQLLAETGLKNLRLAREMEQRKQIDRELVLLHSALNNSRDAAYLIGDQFRFIYVNDVACRVMGYSREELLNMGITDIDPDLNEEALAQIVQHTRTVGANSIETRHRAKDGHIFPVEVTGAVFEHEGQYYNLAMACDISERKQAEQQLQLLNYALDNVHEGAFLIDLQGRFLYVNQEACRSLGYTSDELCRMGILDIDPNFSPDIQEEHFASLLKCGTLTFETLHRTQSGRIFPVEITSTVLEYGGVKYLLSLVRHIAERKRMEETLRESEERFRLLVELSPDLIFIRHQEEIVYANPAAARLVRAKSAGELIGRSVLDFARPERREQLKALMAANDAKPDGEVLVSHEGSMVRLDGSIVPIELTAIRFQYRGKPCCQQIMRDISERKQAESALRNSEETFRTLAENSPDNIARYDTQRRLIYGNPRLFQTLQLPVSPLGKTPMECLPGGEFREYEQRVAQVLASGEEAVIDIVLSGADQEVRHHNVRFVAERGADGEVSGVLAIGRDITEHMRAENKIRLLQNHLNNIIDSMPSILVGITPNGTVTHWNRKAEQASGFGATQAIGKPVGALLPEFSGCIEALADEIAQGRQASMEKILVEKGGERRFHDLILYPLVTNGVAGAVIRIEDVTEKSQMQEAMIQAEKMISLGGLAGGMAHELNNPLGIITQAVKNIQRRLSVAHPANLQAADKAGISLEKLDAYFTERRITELFASIDKAATRAARIIANMLNFSSHAQSTMQLHSLALVVEHALELAANDYDLKKHYDFRDIEIVREFCPAMPDLPMMAIEMEQVTLNLLKNAAQALGSGLSGRAPRITLRIRRGRRHALLEVEDNGAGMPEQVRRRVFEPFFTTKPPGEGTGLGLSVSYIIVTRNHKGLIEVVSAPGSGTRFTVKLPLRKEDCHD